METGIALFASFCAGFLAFKFWGRGAQRSAEKAAKMEAESHVKAAKKEREDILKAAEMEGKEIALKLQKDSENKYQSLLSELKSKEKDLHRKKEELKTKNKKAEKWQKDLDKRERSIGGRESAALKMVEKAEAEQNKAKQKLEQVAGIGAEEARKELESLLVDEAKAKVSKDIQQIENKAKEEAAEKSKTIVATAIQRFASEFVSERTVSVIPLPSDDMKGRLIGREGRNIRALEAAAGIDMIIDDTSEAITISCFNPVRREIARIAVEKLVSDGRIHPTRIEEAVSAAGKEIDDLCKEAGEQAVFDLGLHKVHPTLVLALGKLKYRHSFTQNVLQHSVEVGFLAGLIAAELGLSVKKARRAGLLHDIGKSVDHEHEGSHADVGAQFARKHGESPSIYEAIKNHHGDAHSVLDHIVEASNNLSGARPGARRELLASYIKRLSDLEVMAESYNGVEKAFAIQAGRELRVLVKNADVDDAGAHMLSKELANRIENESTYAGEIKVVVVRETRASDYAQ